MTELVCVRERNIYVLSDFSCKNETVVRDTDSDDLNKPNIVELLSLKKIITHPPTDCNALPRFIRFCTYFYAFGESFYDLHLTNGTNTNSESFKVDGEYFNGPWIRWILYIVSSKSEHHISSTTINVKE